MEDKNEKAKCNFWPRLIALECSVTIIASAIAGWVLAWRLGYLYSRNLSMMTFSTAEEAAIWIVRVASIGALTFIVVATSILIIAQKGDSLQR